MSACIRAFSAQRLWLSASTRVCRCHRSVQLRRYPSTPFSSFAFLSRVSKPSTTSQPQPSPSTPSYTFSPTAAPRTPAASSGDTTVVPDSSSPYMQEDAMLERVALVGYGPDHFEVFNPSSLSQSASSSSPRAAPTSAGKGEEESTTSVPVTASVVSSVAAPTTRSGLLSRGVFSAPNTITMFGGVIALPTAAFLWAPTEWEQVTVESLAILDLIQNKPDLILFGTGSRIRPLPPSVSLYLQQLGIGYEVLQSNKALATFNMLVEEERLVMAALVPYGEEAGAKVEQTTEDNRPSAALRRRIEEQLAQETS